MPARELLRRAPLHRADGGEEVTTKGPIDRERTAGTMTTDEYHTEVNRRMREDVFQSQVIATAHDLGYRVAHFRTVAVRRKDGTVHYETPVQADGKGWPDLHLSRARDHRVFYAELKTISGRVSPEQEAWIAWLRECGETVYLWRPGDDYQEVLQ